MRGVTVPNAMGGPRPPNGRAVKHKRRQFDGPLYIRAHPLVSVRETATAIVRRYTYIVLTGGNLGADCLVVPLPPTAPPPRTSHGHQSPTDAARALFTSAIDYHNTNANNYTMLSVSLVRTLCLRIISAVCTARYARTRVRSARPIKGAWKSHSDLFTRAQPVFRLVVSRVKPYL